jgi:hypothetical protein
MIFCTFAPVIANLHLLNATFFRPKLYNMKCFEYVSVETPLTAYAKIDPSRLKALHGIG